MAAMPTTMVIDDAEVVIVTSVQLNWLSRMLAEFDARPSTEAFLLDSDRQPSSRRATRWRTRVGSNRRAEFPLQLRSRPRTAAPWQATGLNGRTAS